MQPELIETILVDAQRRMPLLARHLKRLEASCKALDYAWAGPAVEADILVAALALSAPGRTGCACWWRATAAAASRPPLPPLPAVQEVMLAPEALRSSEPLLRYKTTPPWYTKTIEWLPSHPHLFDLLYLNERGELCEGSRSNVYLRLGAHWYTPPVDCGCLPGCSAPSCWKPARRRKRC